MVQTDAISVVNMNSGYVPMQFKFSYHVTTLVMNSKHKSDDCVRSDRSLDGSPVLVCDQTLLWRIIPCNNLDSFVEQEWASFPTFP